ncbi:MAG: protein kinase [Planctomycetota bacterium]|nr:protein kinase [Planctomycetota bacterium]
MGMRESERLARWLLHSKIVPETVLTPLWHETRSAGSDLAELLLARGHLDAAALENLKEQANKAWESHQNQGGEPETPSNPAPQQAPAQNISTNNDPNTMRFERGANLLPRSGEAPLQRNSSPAQSYAQNMVTPTHPQLQHSGEASYAAGAYPQNMGGLGQSGVLPIPPAAPMMRSGEIAYSNPVMPVNPVNSSGIVQQSNPMNALVHSTASNKSASLSPSWDTSQGDSGEVIEAQLEQLGDFVVHEEISRGGMGVVFRAHYKPEDAEVALKLMLAKDPSIESVERFEREAQSLTLVDHPNIVRLYDQGTNAGRPYFAMELIRGVSLKQYIKDYMKLHSRVPDYDWSCQMLGMIGKALISCHDKGIYHRDVKPENILIENDPDGGVDRPVLVDFGLVKQDRATLVEGEDGEICLTKTGEVMGTPAYMAPEQLEKGSHFGEIGAHTDAWGLAATLYYCVSGQAPYKGASLVNIYKALMTHNPESVCSVNDDVPPWLDGLIASALIRESANRIDMRSFVERLDEPDQFFAVKKNVFRGLVVVNIGIVVALAFFLIWMNQDRDAPVLKLPPIPKLVNARELRIEGTVEDESPDYVVAKVGSKTVRSKVDESGAFRLTLKLSETQNKIKFIAVDKGGNRSSAFETQIRFDEDPAVITAPKKLPRTFDSFAVLTGELSEAGCVLKVKGAVDLLVKSRDFRYSVPVKVGPNKLSLTVVDPAGNVSPPFIVYVQRDPTLRVGPKERYKSIGSAYESIANDARGRIQLEPGEYTVENMPVSKYVEIRGDPKAREKYRLVGPKGSCFTIDSRHCRLSGLSFSMGGETGLPNMQLIKVSSGKAFIDHCYFSSKYGGGVGVVSINEGNKSSLAMESTVIESCGKGAVVVQGPGAKVAMSDCTISDNKEMGLWIFAGGTASVRKCTFSRNQRAFYTWENSTLEATDCELSYSKEEGYLLKGGGDKNTAVLTKCQIHHNGIKRKRGIHSYGGHLTMRNCEVFLNGYHGMEISEKSKLVLEDSKIRGNRGHGLYADESEVLISNTEFTKNRGTGVYSSRGSVVSYKKLTFNLNERRFNTRYGGKFVNLEE